MKAFTYLLLIFFSAAFCSCLTTHKTKSSHTEERDSSVTAVIEKQGISLSDSSHALITDSSFQDVIKVIYDTVPLDFISEEDPVQRAIDLAGPEKIKQKKKPTHSININGNIIQSSQPLKEVQLITGGRVQKFDVTTLMKKDSGQVSEANQTTVATAEETKNKNVVRKVSPIVFIVGGALSFLLLLFLFRAWPFSFLFTLKNKQDGERT